MSARLPIRSDRGGAAVALSCLCLLSGCLHSLADNLDEWTLQDTNRASVNFPALAVTCNSNLLVGVGAGVILSTNGQDWLSPDVSQYPFTNIAAPTLWDVAYGNGVFVAVGVHYYGARVDAILTSEDGTNWIEQPQSVSNGLYALTFANGMFVTVGGQGNVWRSTDGTNWQHSVTATSNDLLAVCYGNGLFVAGGYAPMIASSDGITWSNVAGSYGVRSLAYGQGRFVAMEASQYYAISSDGTNWSQYSLPWSDPDFYPYMHSVTFAHGTFLASGWEQNSYGSIGPGIIFTSPDGQNWVQRPSVAATKWNDSVLWDDTFVLVGTAVAQSEPFSGPIRPPRLLSNPQSLIALGGSGVSFAVTGDDTPPLGYQWLMNGQPMSGQTNASLSLIASLTNAADYILVASNITGSVTTPAATLTVVNPVAPVPPYQLPATLGSNIILGTVVSSNTPVTYRWQVNLQNIPAAINSTLTLTNVQLSNAAPFDVVVSNAVGAVTTPSLFLTVEPYADHPLYHWTNETPSWLPATLSVPSYYGPGSLNGVAFGNGLFVAVGSTVFSDYGVIVTSSDGANWALQRGPASGQQNAVYGLFGVTYANGTFVAVGYNSSIYSSTNGVNWNLRYSGAYESYFSIVVFRNGMFLVPISSTTVLQSADGINWSVKSNYTWPGYSDLPAFVGGIYATVSNTPTAAVVLSTNAVDWKIAGTSSNRLYDLAFGNGFFVAVGQYGTILRSEAVARIDWNNSLPPQLAVRGLVGLQYGVESRDSLADSNGWSAPATFLLTNNPALVPVVTAPSPSQQFFRAVLLQ